MSRDQFYIDKSGNNATIFQYYQNANNLVGIENIEREVKAFYGKEWGL